MLEEQLNEMRENLSKLSAQYGTTLEDMIQSLKNGNELEDLSINIPSDYSHKDLVSTGVKSRSMKTLSKKEGFLNKSEGIIGCPKNSVKKIDISHEQGSLLAKNLEYFENSLSEMNVF